MAEIILAEGSASSTPSTGKVALYAKTDGLLYSKDDAGAETALGGGTSLPVVDTTGIAKGSSDATKIVRLEVDGLTTGTTRVLTVPDADLTIVGTATTQTLTNKTLTAPIISTISNTGTVTLFTATDTVVGKATTDTLTNKTINADNNTITNIGSSEITADIITGLTADASPDGSADYIMTYDNSATALKKVLLNNLPSGSSLPVTDTTGIAKGSSDATKIVRLEVDGLTTGTTRVMTVPDADLTITGIATTQTLTNKTMAYSSNTFTGFKFQKQAIIRDQRTGGTAGGSSSATTWNARTLQTEHYDPDGIVSIASNQFTPIAGDYIIDAWAECVRAVSNLLYARIRIYNVTAAAVVAYGINTSGSSDTVSGLVYPHIITKFTANGTDAYRFETYSSTAQATNGLGIAQSITSTDEVYLEAILYLI